MMTETADIKTISFSAGLPGFPEAQRFEMRQWGDGNADNPFWLLESLEVDGLAFVVTTPWAFYPEYDFELDDVTARRIGLRSPGDVVVLAIVTVGERAEDSSINLLGPVVVNRHTGDAAQVVLSELAYDVNAPLVRS
ncbi:MAG: flagellar assembly protein FliW [Acidimicrobiia bacterium]